MRVRRELYEDMVAHAMAEAPKECCGMVGSRDSEAVEVFRARNAAAEQAARVRFEIDPEEQLAIHNRMAEAGLDLGAIYHSHTRTEPEPSQTDINFARWWPGVLWIIVGVAQEGVDVRTWRIDDGTVAEAELILE
jgi:proteasome lid subunit RPN8/RPN11